MQALRSKGVPYLTYLPYLFLRRRARARTHVHVCTCAHVDVPISVWTVWKVCKSKAQQGFQGSIPRNPGVEGREPGQQIERMAEWMH